MLVSIDPGLNHVAFAAWSDAGTLLEAGLARNPSARNKALQRPEIWSAAASAVVRRVMAIETAGLDPQGTIAIVVEIPTIRQRGSGKGDPNDLIDVAGVAASCVQCFKSTAGAWCAWAPLPEQWKGQLPKEVSANRALGKLTEAEKLRIEKVNPGLLHNVYDAIHLGLVHFKR